MLQAPGVLQVRLPLALVNLQPASPGEPGPGTPAGIASGWAEILFQPAVSRPPAG